MAKALFSVLLKFIKSIVNIFLTPINALVVNLFPDLSTLLSTFNSAVSQIIGGNIAFFSHLLPPTTRTFIIFYLTLLISYYTITISVHLVLKVINIIRRVKIW